MPQVWERIFPQILHWQAWRVSGVSYARAQTPNSRLYVSVVGSTTHRPTAIYPPAKSTSLYPSLNFDRYPCFAACSARHLRVAISTVPDASGSGRVDMLTSPVAAARAAVATGAWVKSKHDTCLIRGSVGA